MTHPEVSSLFSLEHGVHVPEVQDNFERGWGDRDEVAHVDEIADRIKEHGYDERFPLQVSMGSGSSDMLINGNHRASAVHQTGHPLTPVVYHENEHGNSYHDEMVKQDRQEFKDHDSGKKMKHYDYGWRL